MMHHITPHQGRKPKHVPAYPQEHSDFKKMFSQFWNMLDFPHSRAIESMEPKIEIKENRKNVTVTAEIPGVSEKDIDIELSSEGYLTISGEKRHQSEESSEGNYISEISYGKVQRTISLPWDLEFSSAEASYEDGILKITLPKTAGEQQKKKKISIGKNNKKND